MIDPEVTRLAIEALDTEWDRMPGGGFSDKAQISEITRGGSDRHFLRVQEDGLTAVMLVQPGAGPEFERYVRIGDFLRGNGIAVPNFYSVDKRGVVIMEDLGNIHLVDALDGADLQAELSFYRECIDIILRLHSTVTEAEREAGLLNDMIFSEDVLLGESEYFAREFVTGYAGLRIPDGWDEERGTLARELASQPPVFMHRDFQSRNIMVKDGRLRVLDFQTAHRGPGMYDLASLLKDPYHPVEPGSRKTLLMEVYYRVIGDGSEPEGGFEGFNDRFLLAGIQRNMQALAAFSYLGMKKGKTEFLRYILPGIGLLEEGLTESGRFPVTSGLVAGLRDRIIERNT
jgi:aminoglycoside/choline kinase family phosphotransferase